MGLLDEAIREHLELRRLRGVDPGEIARDEEAALGASEGELADRSDDYIWAESPGTVAPVDMHAGIAVGAGIQKEALYTSQETVEIDMSAFLGVGTDDAEEPRRVRGEENRDIVAPVSAAVTSRAPSLESELDRLDWEVSRTRPLAGRARRDGDLDR